MTRNPVASGNHHLDLCYVSSEPGTLLNSQVVCLRPAGIFNNAMFNLNYLFQMSAWMSAKKMSAKNSNDTALGRPSCLAAAPCKIEGSSTKGIQSNTFPLKINIPGQFFLEKHEWKFCGTSFRVLPNFQVCFYNSIETRRTSFLITEALDKQLRIKISDKNCE